MNRSYSKIRHIQEANVLLENRTYIKRVILEDANMDKMIADTQALAQGAVGITFPDGSSQPMTVGSASVVSNQPENWKLGGAIVLVMNTNFGGTAKSIRIGLLTDSTNVVKLVGVRGALLPIDANGIYQALLNHLGQAYKPTLDTSIKANPSPYKTLITVLTGIAEKYKTSGLAAPTK
jgi:hypothetical protein